MTHPEVDTIEPEIEQVVSLPPKEPLTPMVCPAEPEGGLRKIAVTVKVAWAWRRCLLSVILTISVYGLCIESVPITTNEPPIVLLSLLVMLQMGLLTKVLRVPFASRLPNTQDTALLLPAPMSVPFGKLKPEPDTLTSEPRAANVGLNETEGCASTGCSTLT